MAVKNHVRSISLPSRSHPSTLVIEQELNKLRTFEPSCPSTSASICSGLSGLEDLYKYTDDLLKGKSTQKVLSLNQSQIFVDEFLDGSIRLMDVCSAVKDLVYETNEHVRALQSAFRRRKGGITIEGAIAGYTCFRKNMNKEAKKLIACVKQTDNRIRVSQIMDQDHHLTAVIYVLKEVSATSISIFKSLLSFLSAPVLTKHKRSKWSMVSKMFMKGKVALEEKKEKEIEIVDSAIYRYQDCSEVQEKLEDMETGMEGLEKRLESVFRRLIKTRATVLNIISQ